MGLQDFKDDLARAATGLTVAEAHAQEICIVCRKPPTWYSEAGRREYLISAVCEPCFDAMFGEEEPCSQTLN